MILSAHYANPDHTAAIAQTSDFGAVCYSQDTPAKWAELLAWGTPSAYVAPSAPIPETISDRQFFQALALQGTITQAEAIAAVATGTIPAALRSFIEALTGAEAFAAEMLLSGATEFKRSHPLTVAIGAAQGMSPAQIDAFFQFASGL